MTGEDSLDGLVGLLDAVLDPDAMLGQVAVIARYDRYQASHGLIAAAAEVAAMADQAGLRQVGTTTYPADGELRWWTWRAPVSWTPDRAELTLRDGSGAPVGTVSHADSPFTIATYSAPVEATLPIVRLGSGHPVTPGDLVYVPAEEWRHGAVVAELVELGAAGFVTAAPAVQLDGRDYPGRIELSPRSPLFGFSVVPAVAELIERHTDDAVGRRAADRQAVGRHGLRAEVLVRLAPEPAPMPVTSAVLPGSSPELPEVWLVAHLCHPRPGGNDNASGVAALLGIARTLARSVDSGRLPQAHRTIRFLWGPEFLGPIAALSDHLADGRPPPAAVVDLDVVGVDQSRFDLPFVVELPFQQTDPLGELATRAVRSAFRRTAEQPGSWRAEPFTGFSDHAVFADPRLGCSAVQLCHVGDPANHSAADQVELVSPVQLRRSALAGAAIAWSVASRPSWQPAAGHAAGDCAHPGQPCAVLHRRWDGPLNVREMVSRVPGAAGQSLRQLLARDKRLLSVLLNLGLSTDSRHCQTAVLDQLDVDRSLSLGPSDRELLIEAFTSTGWADLVPAGAVMR